MRYKLLDLKYILHALQTFPIVPSYVGFFSGEAIPHFSLLLRQSNAEEFITRLI